MLYLNTYGISEFLSCLHVPRPLSGGRSDLGALLGALGVTSGGLWVMRGRLAAGCRGCPSLSGQAVAQTSAGRSLCWASVCPHACLSVALKEAGAGPAAAWAEWLLRGTQLSSLLTDSTLRSPPASTGSKAWPSKLCERRLGKSHSAGETSWPLGSVQGGGSVESSWGVYPGLVGCDGAAGPRLVLACGRVQLGTRSAKEGQSGTIAISI